MDIFPINDVLFVIAFVVIWAQGFTAGMHR